MGESEKQDIGELLSGYLDGELSPENRVRVERALRDDPSLKLDLDRWRRLDETMHAGEPPPLSAEQWQRVWETVQARTGAVGHEGARSRRRLVRMVWLAAALAAAVLLAVSYLFVMRGRRLSLPSTIADGAPDVERSEPGEGYRGVTPELGEDAPLRIDYEAVAE